MAACRAFVSLIGAVFTGRLFKKPQEAIKELVREKNRYVFKKGRVGDKRVHAACFHGTDAWRAVALDLCTAYRRWAVAIYVRGSFRWHLLRRAQRVSCVQVIHILPPAVCYVGPWSLLSARQPTHPSNARMRGKPVLRPNVVLYATAHSRIPSADILLLQPNEQMVGGFFFPRGLMEFG